MLVLLALSLCCSFVPQFVGGVRFPRCFSNRLQVDERNDTVITCDQIGAQDTVEWLYGRSDQSDVISLGTCLPAGPCSPVLYTLSRKSTQSTVTITPSIFIRKLTKIICGKQGDTSSRVQCLLDVVYPAELSSTTAKVEAKNGSWTVEGSIDITKVFSSMNYYKCQVYRGTNEQNHPTKIIDKTYSTSSRTDTNYTTGSCTFSYQFSNLLNQVTTRQDFYFRFVVYPGPTQVSKGPVTIERPATPTIKCPHIVGENSPFTCTCSTTNIGQPAGRLFWSLNNNVQQEGTYGDTTLTTRTIRLQRGDNGRTKITCDMRWAVATTSAVYTANVGYPPSQATLTVNPKSSPTVNENSSVSFTCTASESNPTSTLRLSNTQSTSLKEGTSSLTHSLRAQCEHSGLFTCTARNGFGGDVTATATLYVNCKPRGDENIGSVNFINDSVSETFDVIAYPTPNRCSFMFLGQNGTEAATAVQSQSIQLNCSCTQTGPVYMSTCRVSVSSVTTAEAAGFYQVIVGNTIGTGSFKLEVKYKEPVATGGQTGGDDTPVAAIIGGILAAVVIIMLISGILIFVMRRKKKGPGKEKLHTVQLTENELDNGSRAEGASQPTAAPLSFSPPDEYAVVNKGKKPGEEGMAADSTAVNNSNVQPDATYAVVDKSRNDPGAGDGGTKAKAAAKKPKKKEKKKKADRTDEAAHVYGNVEDTKPRKKNVKPSAPPKQETSTGGPQVNQDGLLYSSVVFTNSASDNAPPTPKTEEEGVLYSAVDFSKSAPPQ